MSLPGSSLRFQLALSDPILSYVPDDFGWTSTEGDWIVSLGEVSTAKRGVDENLPVVRCSVNDLSRLWFGVCSADSLTVIGTLEGDPETIASLDEVITLPTPNVDWDF